MIAFQLPSWINRHLYQDRTFAALQPDEIEDLKNRLKKFKDPAPDISVVIPAWNEEDSLFRTLSSLADNLCQYKVEIIVINNNSTDRTPAILDQLGVRSYTQPRQGIAFARQMGLRVARGKYHLCADSDTIYPPRWMELMVEPMMKDERIVCVYGRYAFIPPEGESRLPYYLYERMTGIAIRYRNKAYQYVNVLGFTMGFVAEIGRNINGFEVEAVRKFDNRPGQAGYVMESGDGRMALALAKTGSLKLIAYSGAVVYTSPRRLMLDGGIALSFKLRMKRELRRIRYDFLKLALRH